MSRCHGVPMIMLLKNCSYGLCSQGATKKTKGRVRKHSSAAGWKASATPTWRKPPTSTTATTSTSASAAQECDSRRPRSFETFLCDPDPRKRSFLCPPPVAWSRPLPPPPPPKVTGHGDSTQVTWTPPKSTCVRKCKWLLRGDWWWPGFGLFEWGGS